MALKEKSQQRQATTESTVNAASKLSITTVKIIAMRIFIKNDPCRKSCPALRKPRLCHPSEPPPEQCGRAALKALTKLREEIPSLPEDCYCIQRLISDVFSSRVNSAATRIPTFFLIAVSL